MMGEIVGALLKATDEYADSAEAKRQKVTALLSTIAKMTTLIAEADQTAFDAIIIEAHDLVRSLKQDDAACATTDPY
jgi:hypothetical protein